MASVFKAAGASKYTILWFDENGKRRKSAGFTDKRESQKEGIRLEERARKIKNGDIDLRNEAYRGHEAKTLAEHLDEFKAALASKGGSKRHPEVTRSRAAKVLELAKIKRISELSLSKASNAVAATPARGAVHRNHQPPYPGGQGILAMAAARQSGS